MRQILVVSLAAALLAFGAYGQGKGNSKGGGNAQGQGNGKHKAKHKGPGGGVDIRLESYRFPSSDIGVIRGYYRPRIGNLPPGLEKQLIRNGTLPPGLQKKLMPFPAELNGRFAPMPAGYTRFVVGTRAVVVEVTTNRVMDFFDLN